MTLRGMFAAALAGFGLRGRHLSPEQRRARDEAKEQKLRERVRGWTSKGRPPVLPVVPFDQRPTPASVLAHREKIAASRRGEGPFFTAPKHRAADAA